MENHAVQLKDIRKSYRIGLRRERKAAVRDLSLTVDESQIFGLLGPNAAGKTTTLKVLLGLIFPEEGMGSLLGKPLGDRSTRARIGFLPEQPYFYGFLTAEKGLDLYAKFFGLDPEERDRRSCELLERVGLRRGSHLTLDKYSKGMLQRFGIAQALMNDPEMVVMDEPSSGLDPVGQKEVRDILLSLKEEGKTIFLSSHQLSEVENICDAVTIISEGRTVREGKLSELLQVEDLSRVILQGVSPRQLEELEPLARNVERVDARAILDVEKGTVYELLGRAERMGLELVSVAPYRRTLEDLFLEAVKESPD